MPIRTTFASPPHDEPVDQDLAQPRRLLALEARQEYALAKRWREHNDPEAERRLVTSHLRLVAEIAWSYRAYNLPFSKLIYEGNRALMEAVKHFDPDRGYRLATYSKRRIHAAIVDYVFESLSHA